jgi:hypothetical protein
MHGVVPLGEIIPGLQTDAAVGDAVGEKVGFAVMVLAVGEKAVGEKVGFAVVVLAVGEKAVGEKVGFLGSAVVGSEVGVPEGTDVSPVGAAQIVDPAPEVYVPGEQTLQVAAPSEEAKVPAGHEAHSTPPLAFAYFPD